MLPDTLYAPQPPVSEPPSGESLLVWETTVRTAAVGEWWGNRRKQGCLTLTGSNEFCPRSSGSEARLAPLFRPNSPRIPPVPATIRSACQRWGDTFWEPRVSLGSGNHPLHHPKKAPMPSDALAAGEGLGSENRSKNPHFRRIHSSTGASPGWSGEGPAASPHHRRDYRAPRAASERPRLAGTQRRHGAGCPCQLCPLT